MTVSAKEVKCPSIARFDHLRLDAVKRLHHAVDLIVSAARRQIGNYSPRKSHKPNIVPSGSGDISYGQRCIDRVVELGELADSGGHQAPGVQKNHDVLTSFDGVLSRYELAAARGCCPRNVANL